MKSTLLSLSMIAMLSFSAIGQSDISYLAELEKPASYDPAKNNINDKVPALAGPTNSRAQAKFNLSQYLFEQVKYPELASTHFIEGKVVARVTIDANGQVQEVTIVEALGFGCDEEVIRTLQNMPNWTPARRNGVNVAQQIQIPVHFILQ